MSAPPRLLQVFEDTSLASVYGITNHPSHEQLGTMQVLLDEASAATGSPVQLPVISHAPGFDKYKELAPGAAAHEAGYGELLLAGIAHSQHMTCAVSGMVEHACQTGC
jgi:hypothetical protein